MKRDDSSVIAAIEQATSEGCIPRSDARLWLQSRSLQVLGAVVHNVLRNTRIVNPPLEMEEICNCMERYYERCLVDNPQGNGYELNRSIAGLELVSWFGVLWRDESVPREYLTRIKQMLRSLLVEKKVPQEELVGAVLEHLFENSEFVEFFSDWKDEPGLNTAFSQALEWNHH